MGSLSLTKRLGLVLGAVLYAALAVWNQVRVNPGFPSDAAIYFDAVHKASEGKDPYHPFHIGPSFVYPPPALLVGAPFATLSGERGRFLWAGLGIACYAAALALLVETFRPALRGWQAVGLAAFALLFAPFLETLTIGQVNPIILLALSLFILGLSTPRYAWVGDVALAVAAATKISPIVLLAIPLSRRDWKRCGRVVAGLVSLSGLSILAFGLNPWRGFMEVLPKLFSGFPGTINQAVGPTLALAAGKLGWYLDSGLVSRAFSILILGVFALVVWRFRAEESALLSLASVGVASMTVGSGLIWHHHLTFLVIPIVGVLLSCNFGWWRSLAVAMMLGALLLIQADRYIENRFGIPPAASILGYLLVFGASLLALKARNALSNPLSAR
jgi:hypothetical protein